jgi:hypothetical protein
MEKAVNNVINLKLLTGVARVSIFSMDVRRPPCKTSDNLAIKYGSLPL